MTIEEISTTIRDGTIMSDGTYRFPLHYDYQSLKVGDIVEYPRIAPQKPINFVVHGIDVIDETSGNMFKICFSVSEESMFPLNYTSMCNLVFADMRTISIRDRAVYFYYGCIGKHNIVKFTKENETSLTSFNSMLCSESNECHIQYTHNKSTEYIFSTKKVRKRCSTGFRIFADKGVLYIEGCNQNNRICSLEIEKTYDIVLYSNIDSVFSFSVYQTPYIICEVWCEDKLIGKSGITMIYDTDSTALEIIYNTHFVKRKDVG